MLDRESRLANSATPYNESFRRMLDLIVVPSLIGFLIKLYFIYISRSSISKNNFSALLLICAFHSLCECVTLISLSFGNNVELLFRMYYVLIIWWFGYSFIYACEISNLNKLFQKSALLTTVVISALILLTDLVISGYHSNGFSITADRERFFGIAPAFVLLMSVASIAILVVVKTSSKSETKNKVKAHFLLIAMLVPVVVITAVIIAMTLHLKMNAMIAFPVATTLFFLFIIQSEKKHKLSDMLRFNPFSLESKFTNEMRDIAKRFASNEITLKESNNEIQKAHIKYALAISKDKSVTQISKDIGVPTSTLYSIIERHNLKQKQ